MVLTNFLGRRSVPDIATKKTTVMTTDFSKGIYTQRPNDAMGYDELYLAQDARFDRVGEYMTRKGLTMLSEPIGKAVRWTNIAEGGQQLDVVDVKSPSITSPSSRPICSVALMVSRVSSDYGVLRVDLKAGEKVVASTSLDPELATESPQRFELFFPEAPVVDTNDEISVLLSVQRGGNPVYQVATTEDGVLMMELYDANAGGISNIFEVSIDDTKTVLFVQNNSLYKLEENGAVDLLRELPEGVKKVRFSQNTNIVRYADGLEQPHKLDPKDGWTDEAIDMIDLQTDEKLNIQVSNIMDGQKDNLVYFDAETTTQAIWGYPYGTQYKREGQESAGPINSYDFFDRDFRQNFPAILTGDPLTAMFNLGGVLYFLTRKNKYYMISQTADTWTQGASLAQNGTFSQESVVCDLNNAYYANENGIFVFDGSTEYSITDQRIQNMYDEIQTKESIVLDMFGNRLYVFYASQPNGVNDSCLVYNTSLKIWESFDTNAFVSATCARKAQSKRFIVGHSRIGMLMLAESPRNRNDNLGGALKFELETPYHHFGAPSQLKRIIKWRPEFAKTKRPYNVECGYAVDFTDDVKYAYSINLLDQTIIKEHDYVWDEPNDYHVGMIPTKLSTVPRVQGDFRRCQIRYQHYAAFEPIDFKSHMLSIQVQRVR